MRNSATVADEDPEANRFEREFSQLINSDKGYVEGIAGGLAAKASSLQALTFGYKQSQSVPQISKLSQTQLRKLLLQFGHCMNAEVLSMLLTDLDLSGCDLTLEACQSVLRACRERWPACPDATVCIFVNPSSGGNLAARWLELPATVQFHSLTANDSDTCSNASLHVLNLRDSSLIEQPGFLRLKEQAGHKSVANPATTDASGPVAEELDSKASKPRVIVAGGDGTVTWVLSVLEQGGVDSTAVAVGVCPYGTGNDFSRVLGWGTSPISEPHRDVDSLHALLGRWLSAELAPLDLWALRATTKSDGSIALVQKDGSLGLSEADSKRLNVQTTAEGLEMSRYFVNYFSMGVAAQMGIAFDQQRGTSRTSNLLVYAKEGAKKAMSARTSVEVDAIASHLADGDCRVFSTCPDATKEEQLSDRVLSLIFLNIPSMAGGSDLWGRATSLALSGARRFQDWKQDFGDGFLELLTYSSALGFVREKLGPAAHGNGQRLHSGRGPFRLQFRSADDERYIEALQKTGNFLFMQTDGEYFAVGAPDSVEVTWARGITALHASKSAEVEAVNLFRDGARLLHFIEFAARNNEQEAAAWAYAAAVRLCSGGELNISCDDVAGTPFDITCRPVLSAYQTHPDGLRTIHEFHAAGMTVELSRSASDKMRAFHDVGGSKVDEQHVMYATVISLIRGIRIALHINTRTLQAAVLSQAQHEEGDQVSAEEVNNLAIQCMQRWSGPEIDVAASQIDFVRRFEVRRAGNFLSPPLEVPFVLEDAAPEVFSRLRALAGVSQSAYTASVCNEDAHLRTFSSNSKSGQYFFFSHNGLFMIKSIDDSEAQKVLEMLPSYEEHLRKYPCSLLVRYLGLHRIVLCRETESGGSLFASAGRWFVVMSSVFYTSLGIHEQFDLKGSTSGRKAFGEEANSGSLPGKDLDWLQRFESKGPLCLSPEAQQSLINQHDADTSLLEKFGMMDYSVLVGIHSCHRSREGDQGHGSNRGSISSLGSLSAASKMKERLLTTKGSAKQPDSGEETQAASEERAGAVVDAGQSDHKPPQDAPPDSLHLQQRKPGEAITSSDNNELYFIGIIDTLTTYNSRKAVEDIYNTGKATLTFSEAGHSAVNPSKYRERQKQFFRRVCGVEETSPEEQPDTRG